MSEVNPREERERKRECKKIRRYEREREIRPRSQK